MPEYLLSEPTLTVAEFAERHQLSHHTVYRLIRAGAVPAIRLGRSLRIPESALVATQ
jgi:excisionase family DNA binding protein